jgi:membrane protease YdiL (CAAX protease family)
LLGLLARHRTPLTAAVASSLVFGLWHVLPTLERIASNPATRHRHGDLVKSAAVVAAHVATTTAAGLGFSWLRLRTGSVIAPALAHAAPNVVGFAGGWAVSRLAQIRARSEEAPCDRRPLEAEQPSTSPVQPPVTGP